MTTQTTPELLDEVKKHVEQMAASPVMLAEMLLKITQGMGPSLTWPAYAMAAKVKEIEFEKFILDLNKSKGDPKNETTS